jgi:Fe2+ transport system protein FeoA
MSTLLDTPRTIHLPAEAPSAPATVRKAHKGLLLTDLAEGDSARVVRIALDDDGCRKRFAELGLAEGMKVRILSTGDTLLLMIGSSRMAIASRCAECIHVIRG